VGGREGERGEEEEERMGGTVECQGTLGQQGHLRVNVLAPLLREEKKVVIRVQEGKRARGVGLKHSHEIDVE